MCKNDKACSVSSDPTNADNAKTFYLTTFVLNYFGKLNEFFFLNMQTKYYYLFLWILYEYRQCRDKIFPILILYDLIFFYATFTFDGQ